MGDATMRLPEPDTPVLVTYPGFYNGKPRANLLAYLNVELGWCWFDDDDDDPDNCIRCMVEITHWMPLPEPPKF